ncbi:MAG: glycoside hydrolase family 5 protein [Terracidiphilus sp.]|jgi:endoglucanase
MMHLAIATPHQQSRTRNRAVNRVVFSLMALALVLYSAGAWAQGAGYWHTSGAKILDANGATVRIAGINWYGFEGTNYIAGGIGDQDFHAILDTIKTLGYNVVRIPFSNEMVESDPIPTAYTTWADSTAAPSGGPANQALYGQTALADLDTIVSYAGQIGLRVILDNHRSEAGNSNEPSGLWYTTGYTQADWIADWKTMATRYSASKFTFNGNPTVIAVDLRNEPHLSPSNGVYTGACWTGDTFTSGSYTGCPVTNTAHNWPVAAELAGNAVLAINPKLLIVVEGIDCYDGSCDWQGGNLMGVKTNPIVLSVANQLVYSPHDYGPNLYDQPWFTSNTTAASLAAIWNKYWEYISAAGTAPVWLGEFGTDNAASDIENTMAGSQGQWFEDLVAYLAENPNLSWTNWALNGEDPYDLLSSNYASTPVASTKQSELASIQAPLAAPPASFYLSESSNTLTIGPSGSYYTTIGVTSMNGAESVTLTVTGLPANVTGTFATNPFTTTCKLTFTAGSTAAPGVYTLTITGTTATGTSTETFVLTIS